MPEWSGPALSLIKGMFEAPQASVLGITHSPFRRRISAAVLIRSGKCRNRSPPRVHWPLIWPPASSFAKVASSLSLVNYPFQARINGTAVKINDAAHFVADYDKVITAKVKEAVAQQTYPNLFANWQGVMIGDGEVWFSGIDDKNTVKITAIND